MIEAGITREFLYRLFGDQDHGTLFLAGGRRVGGRIIHWHDTPYDLARASAASIALAAGKRSVSEETYFSCALFAGVRRVEAQAIAYPFLYSDLDSGSLNGMPAPSIVLLTSPNRRQAFWKLRRPVGKEIATDLCRRIAAYCGGDVSGWDATQVLRLPGLRNHKYPGVVTAIESLTDHVYAPDDFAWLPPVLQPSQNPITLAGDADGMTAWNAAYPYLTHKLRAVASGDDHQYGNDPSRADHALMCGLVAAGLTLDEAVAAFMVTPRSRMLAARKGPERIGYLLHRSVARAVGRIGTVVT